MKNYADLGGCYPPQPSASADNTLRDLHNSSYHTQPHPIIAKYLPGEFVDASTWKTRFRCVLRTRRTSDFKEFKTFHSLGEKKPYRVYRFKDKGKIKRYEE